MTDVHDETHDRADDGTSDAADRIADQIQKGADAAVERRFDRVAERIDEQIDKIDSEPVDRFGRVFALILATIVITPLVTQGPIWLVVALLLQLFTVFVALRTSHVGPRALVAVMGVALVAFGLAVVGIGIGDTQIGRTAFALAMLPMIVVVPIAIARRLTTSKRITIHTVWGALSIYLIIGLFFAVLYGIVATFDPPFFAQSSREPLSTDYIYFSFVTLTTVGYGDLTARTATGQMFAVSEALIGQIFLVTIVALLVSRIRPRAREIGEDAPGDRILNRVGRRHSAKKHAEDAAHAPARDAHDVQGASAHDTSSDAAGHRGSDT